MAPLSGVTILDLTHVLAGPYASPTLQDLGAKVIKVERPGTGDDTRAFPPFVAGQSGYFAALNAGKASITLDLKSAPDRALMDRLLPRVDVVLENYRPGVMERLGYGWETLHAKHTRLIYGAVSGFGHTGPDAGKPVGDTGTLHRPDRSHRHPAGPHWRASPHDHTVFHLPRVRRLCGDCRRQ